jgi:uncharacterized protein (TIGR03083 family)
VTDPTNATTAPADPEERAGQRAEQERIVAMLGGEWAIITGVLGKLTDDQWSAQALPGWTVHDVLAHMIGTERALSGAEHPPVPGEGEIGEHVRNDIGRVNEAWVSALRDQPHSDLLAEFLTITGERLASLHAMSAEDFNAPSWTPAGDATYARFMQIRIFDCWMHEQDIRAVAGLPGNEDGPIAEQALAEVIMALGYIVGKRGRAPDGSSVAIRLTGPVTRDLNVVVEGRAKVVESIGGEPTASLTLPSSLFLRLAGGRLDAQDALAQVELGGDEALARQVATNLAYTI